MNSPPGWPGDLASVLHSTGPHPGQAEQLNLFGRFIGAWDIDWHGTDHHGRPATLAGELHFGWVLGGRAVQDVWKVPAWAAARLRPFYGTTLRFYDPAIGTTTWFYRRPRRAGSPLKCRRAATSCWTWSTTTRRSAALAIRNSFTGPASVEDDAARGASTSRCSSAAGAMADAIPPTGDQGPRCRGGADPAGAGGRR